MVNNRGLAGRVTFKVKVVSEFGPISSDIIIHITCIYIYLESERERESKNQIIF